MGEIISCFFSTSTQCILAPPLGCWWCMRFLLLCKWRFLFLSHCVAGAYVTSRGGCGHLPIFPVLTLLRCSLVANTFMKTHPLFSDAFLSCITASQSSPGSSSYLLLKLLGSSDSSLGLPSTHSTPAKMNEPTLLAFCPTGICLHLAPLLWYHILSADESSLPVAAYRPHNECIPNKTFHFPPKLVLVFPVSIHCFTTYLVSWV